MQRLINADKTMKMIEEAKVSDEKSRNFAENIIRFSKTVLTIPDNPTNSDVIKAMFPKWVANLLKFHMGKGWWYSPYKAESEDNNG